MDQSTRYGALDLKEEDMIAEGRHVPRAFETFQSDADMPGPGWRERLGKKAS